MGRQLVPVLECDAPIHLSKHNKADTAHPPNEKRPDCVMLVLHKSNAG